MSNTIQVDTKSFVKDLLARSGHTFVQSFIATLVTLYAASGLDVSSLLSLSGLGKFYTTVVVAAAAALISLVKTTVVAFTKTSQGKADFSKVENDVFGRVVDLFTSNNSPVIVAPVLSANPPPLVADVPDTGPGAPYTPPAAEGDPIEPVPVPAETPAPQEVPAPVEVPAVVVPNPAEQTQTLDEVIAAGA